MPCYRAWLWASFGTCRKIPWPSLLAPRWLVCLVRARCNSCARHRTKQGIAQRRIFEGEKPYRAIQQGCFRYLVDARSEGEFGNENHTRHDEQRKDTKQLHDSLRSVCTTSERIVSLPPYVVCNTSGVKTSRVSPKATRRMFSKMSMSKYSRALDKIVVNHEQGLPP